jgi:hypothetical protein
MTQIAPHACVIGDVAWITGRVRNTGVFNGKPVESKKLRVSHAAKN